MVVLMDITLPKSIIPFSVPFLLIFHVNTEILNQDQLLGSGVMGLCTVNDTCYNQSSSACRHEFGYSGTKSYSLGGRRCLPWNRHYENSLLSQYKYLGDIGYCRITKGWNQPWCIVQSEDAISNGIGWENCFLECEQATKFPYPCITPENCIDTTIFPCTLVNPYQGLKNTSISGKRCSQWNRIYENMVVETYGYLGEHNFCRITSDYNQPWCIVPDENEVGGFGWENCFEGCPKKKGTESTTSDPKRHGFNPNLVVDDQIRSPKLGHGGAEIPNDPMTHGHQSSQHSKDRESIGSNECVIENKCARYRSEKCRSSTGYSGEKVISVTGKQCLPWNGEYSNPMVNGYGDIGTHSKCRTTEGWDYPWCIVKDVFYGVTWEPCFTNCLVIDRNEENGNEGDDGTGGQKNSRENNDSKQDEGEGNDSQNKSNPDDEGPIGECVVNENCFLLENTACSHVRGYTGNHNFSVNARPCLHWNTLLSSPVLKAHTYLGTDNHCKTTKDWFAPWCAVINEQGNILTENCFPPCYLDSKVYNGQEQENLSGGSPFGSEGEGILLPKPPQISQPGPIPQPEPRPGSTENSDNSVILETAESNEMKKTDFCVVEERCFNDGSPGCSTTQGYTGSKSISVSGRACQRWDIQMSSPFLQAHRHLGRDNYCKTTTNWIAPFCVVVDDQGNLVTENCFPPCSHDENHYYDYQLPNQDIDGENDLISGAGGSENGEVVPDVHENKHPLANLHAFILRFAKNLEILINDSNNRI